MRHLNQDVPAYLAELLGVAQKKELKKFAANIAIEQRDFVLLIANSHKIGYAHQIRYNDFVPTYPNPTDSEMASMGKRMKPES